ncbi:MAG: NACHT domain-containing protein [Candidatus Aminicenantes bacterium]|nr:NACHT domain-containing protein [Candidatus Aminicenantes bacterium]NIM81910.1 NACHT domain-containing protein [Candidatus Aminicenantes bacterium]NIN21287.1 NACHT domain-containing protein [Candidatus Aminicenantes bacterium]NIN45108.1 NACHT domain-containing protein [Candidatus Aminicenantes bacterium]NIN87925.1 NACHT domain-containing protein [Candidatus Aminicenantes bacterium]
MTTVETILAGLAINFLTAVTKGTVKGLKKNEMKALLKGAYGEFEHSLKDKGKTDEETLLQVFEKFFTDNRLTYEFQLIFAGKGNQVDFNVLEEIFVGICIDKKIEIKDFNFFQAMSHVIKEIETLVQKKEPFWQAFQLVHLDKIYKQLEKPGMVTNKTYARQTYLRQLITHNQHLQFTGIPDPKEKKDIALPSVFVMQRVKESVPVSDYERMMRERAEIADKDFSGDEIQLRQMMAGQKEEKKEPVKFDKVFAEGENRRFVVLGKPGSGKSTLLKYLMLRSALKILDNPRASHQLLFPILVEIRKFENSLSKTNKTDYNLLHYLYDSMSRYYNVTLPPGFFEEYLDNGRALLMFDGLDEVAAEARRAEVRQMISTFVTSRSKENTVIVTSRIAGYSRAQFSTTDYRHFTLEDFNEDEVEKFIHKWYQSQLTNPEEAKTRADDLKEALERKPRIRELAKNPLLLTIIGIIHRYEAQLPEDRLILYDKATESLLYTWDNVKEIIDEKFKLEDRWRFLEKVAFHLQSLEKGDEAGTVIDGDELYKILFPDFCRIFDVDRRQAKALVDEFLDKIRTRAGLLVEQAPDQYGFVHKTFQEYFAAKWMANEVIVNLDLQPMIDYVDKYIDNAFWQETLLLALRALPNKQAKKVLEHILNRDPKGIEEYLYHNHYFVMKFIAEQGRWLDNKDFVENQIDDFFDFSWNDSEWRSYGGHRTWERFNKWISTVTDSFSRSILTEKLLSLAEDETQSGWLRRSCAAAVGELGLKEKAVEILLKLAENETEDEWIRRGCAATVGELGLKEKAVEILLKLAEDGMQSGRLRRSCAEAVGNLGLKEKAVASRLLKLAEDETQDEWLRRASAVAVGKLGLKEKVVEILVKLAEDETQSGKLRQSCAEAVGNLGLKKKAVEILVKLVEDEMQSGRLRRNCAEAAGNLGLKEKTVASRLLKLAEDETQLGRLRRGCAEAAGNLGLKEKTVADQLLKLAEDETQDVGLRRVCAEGVGNLGLKERRVAYKLLLLAEDDAQDGWLRRSCAEAVGNMGLKEKAVEILLKLAEDGMQSGGLRRSCAATIENLRFKGKRVADRLLELAQDETQPGGLRRGCAAVVGNMGLKEKAVEILLKLAGDETHSERFRKSCAQAAWNIGLKERAVDIFSKLYLAKPDKYEKETRKIYNSLWDLTAV